MTGSAMPTDDEFREIIYGHYHESARGMPWRETDDPYHILVSEIMLQQTQVERVRSAYERFLARFPDIRTLAEAPLADVLALWQGLGYNRRARLLHACAGRIVRERGGKVPESFDELVDLPGIGPSTAGGLMAFAFRTGVPFIETNIRRVYLHFFFPDREGVPDSELSARHRADAGQARPALVVLRAHGLRRHAQEDRGEREQAQQDVQEAVALRGLEPADSRRRHPRVDEWSG